MAPFQPPRKPPEHPALSTAGAPLLLLQLSLPGPPTVWARPQTRAARLDYLPEPGHGPHPLPSSRPGAPAGFLLRCWFGSLVWNLSKEATKQDSTERTGEGPGPCRSRLWPGRGGWRCQAAGVGTGPGGGAGRSPPPSLPCAAPAHPPDPTASLFDTSEWNLVEPGRGLRCACLPCPTLKNTSSPASPLTPSSPAPCVVHTLSKRAQSRQCP